MPLAGASSRGAASDGGNVGAVQVAIRLTSLGALSASADSSEALLLRSAEAAALVPPPLRAALLAPPGQGFAGQPAVLAVHLDAVMPPSSGSSGRPKADRYFCRFGLPGASGACAAVTTAARVLTCVGGGRAAPAPAPAGRQGAEQRQQWAAKINHATFFEASFALC